MAFLARELATLPISIAIPPAIALLFVSFFTMTYTQYQSSLRYLRLGLGLISCLLWYACAFPDMEWPRYIYAGYFFLPALGVKIMLDICFIRFFDRPKDVPRWVGLCWKDEEGKSLDTPRRILLPLPDQLADRLWYAFDSLCSIRGGSFYKNRVFDWAPPYIYEYKSTLTSWQFFSGRMTKVILDLLIWETIETLLVAKKWDFKRADPLTSLPWPQQLFYGFIIGCACITTFLPYDVLTGIFVPLLHGHQEQWPPMWNGVFQSYSLQELWSSRWHATFARVWRRLSNPLVEPARPYVSKTGLRFFRATIVFGLSAVYHNAMTLGFKPDERFYHSKLNVAAFKLFLSQPIGLLIESEFINPLTEKLPGNQKRWIRRSFTYGWILWTGRWFGDYYLHFGAFVKKQSDISPSLYVLTALKLI